MSNLNETKKNLVNLKIDGQDVQVEAGTTILNAAATISNEIPHYCYHPGLSIAGNCRMCLVMVEKMPKPVIACKTTVTEGMVVDSQSEVVKNMQASVMEFLLLNHPLDCPTCDQAGECRLQDYYMKYDVQPSRYTEEKVHKDKMVDLGAGVMLDEERCIVCTRCVRFCSEVAGNTELYVQERGNHSMVSTFPGKEMTNPYAGNTIDICPVGALTSKDFRYKKRVWFLEKTDSVCPGCSRGCNIEIHHADQKIYRLKPRYNPNVNDYWMCDFGRYDYKFVNEDRLLKPRIQDQDVSYEEALTAIAQQIKNYQPGEVAFVASALEQNESLDAFSTFAKTQFAAQDVYFSSHQVTDAYHDNKLITADKNPSSWKVNQLGLKKIENLPANIKAIILQRDLNAADWQIIQQRNIKVLLMFATNKNLVSAEAEVVLPLATYAEQNGSFTNVNGITQEFLPAFAPRGESKPMTFYLNDLQNHLKNLRKAS